MRRSLLILTLLTACGTPQERCIIGVNRDLRVVDRLIATSEGNLKRGYALEEVPVFTTVTVPCGGPVAEGARPQLCREVERDYDTRPKAINLNDEAATLASLRQKRKSLVRQTSSAVAQCKAQFPEA